MIKTILVTVAMLAVSSPLALAEGHTRPTYESGNYLPHVVRDAGKEPLKDLGQTGSIKRDHSNSNSFIFEQVQPTRSSIPERRNDPR